MAADVTNSKTKTTVPPGLTERIDVRVINVEATVTDRSGTRVYGLEPDDFRLEVDGREVPIEYFSEIRGGDLVETKGDDSHSLPGIAPGEPVRTNNLVFIDDYFAVKKNRDWVIDQMEADLDYLTDSDYMAIVAFDGEKTTMLTSWTNDKATIREALKTARERPAHGLERYAELRQSDRERQLSNYPFRRFYDFRLTPLERDYATRLAAQLERETTAASATLQGFAAPPGRKVALLLSGGWPFSPAEYTVSTYYSTFEDVARSSFDPILRGRAELYDGLVNTANLLGYTLYGVDVPGLNPLDDDNLDASRPGPRPVGAGIYDRENVTEHTLRFLGGETGGEALLNGERAHALTEVVRDTRSYYWLGFSARRFDDGQRYDIHLDVKRPGLRVRAREDFVDMTRDTQLDMMVKSALMFGKPPTDGGLTLQVGEPANPDDKKVTVPLKVGIPTDSIFIAEQGDEYLGNLEVYIGVMGPDGALAKTSSQPLTINEPRAPKPGETYWFNTDLQLRRSSDRLAVAVYDVSTGRVLTSLQKLDLTS